MNHLRTELALGIILLAAPLTWAAQESASPSPQPPDLPEQQEETVLPGDWAPQLLDAILHSPNPEAAEALEHASFAAGLDIVPFLEASLKDDRTAEFAAQSLAHVGGEKALRILWNLVSDPRDLNLRRFYYGALSEYNAPQAIETLLDVIQRSDNEPDRTVTEAAILPLTVHSEPSLALKLRELKKEIHDVVIRDGIENAAAVIEMRAKLLAAPQGEQTGRSIQNAVNWYFMPALQSTPAARAGATGQKTAPPDSLVKADIQRLTFSPDKSRALAKVVFEDPSARAFYTIVVQKQYGDWTVASVWLGDEVEKPELLSPAAPTKRRR